MKIDNTQEYVDLMEKRANGILPEMGSAKKIRKILDEHFFRNSSKGFSLLDVGSAAGHYFHSFKNDPIISYTGLEIDPSMVKVGKRVWANTPEGKKVDFINVDFESYNSGRKYDLVYSSNAFMYFYSVENSIRKFIDLASNGFLIRSYFCNSSYKIARAQTELNHSGVTISELDNIDIEGNFKYFDFWNIYSFTLIESIIRKYSISAEIIWIDNESVINELNEEKKLNISKRGATEVLDGIEISYPFILPWKYLLVKFK